MGGAQTAILGAGNGAVEYALVLLVYAALFLLIRQGNPRLDPGFRHTFVVLCFGWAFCTFIGNYTLYLMGYMSFLPWLNNALHTFAWIGLCLGFLYAGVYRKAIWEQCALFVIYSFIVKVAENGILGTWEHDHFFGIDGNWPYIIGWSLMDGLYPFLSIAGLRLVSRFDDRVVVPEL